MVSAWIQSQGLSIVHRRTTQSMSTEDEAAMMAALGFASFGNSQRQRKRARRSPPRAPPLPQLMPGTELADALLSTRYYRGPHGVCFLVKDTENDDALRQALAPRDEEYPSRNTCGSDDHDQQNELLERLADAKRRFDALSSEEFLSARSACNPFERLGRHRFLNRSAMKLVTLDHIFQWTACARSSSPREFAFTDICGGPGGFSEYLLWRLQQQTDQSVLDESTKSNHIEGFGISLRDAANLCDWRLPQDLALIHVDDGSKDPSKEKRAGAHFTISYGADGTGDLYSVENIQRFRDVVRTRCPLGVALSVADGGFLDARDRDNQESMMTRLVTAEVLAMLYVLRPGGDFVCKTFELSTPVMRELVWLLHQCFDKLAIVKPVTSRPASSERYIVARSLRSNLPLEAITELLVSNIGDPNLNDSLLPNPQPFCEDAVFRDFIIAANDSIATVQISACENITEFAEASDHWLAFYCDSCWEETKETKYFNHVMQASGAKECTTAPS